MWKVLVEKTRRILGEEGGQDLIEYALLGALIGVACIAAMGTIAANIAAELTNVAGKIT